MLRCYWTNKEDETMAKILILEPNYTAKYPPLGLMRIAYFHKYIRKDYPVIFAKGQLSEKSEYVDMEWDRIYISTMFTYEWKETIRAIEYAKKLVNGDTSKIFIGGIACTLMPEDFEKETGIRPITGLLNERGKLGYNNDEVIDCLPPDYSILDDVSYKYEAANNYFAYTTRGCGMNCSFCAVKTLEPTYIERVSISEQIAQVRTLDKADGKTGELKRNLLLLDNNVLRSKLLPEIIKEIKNLGFQKGATFINQKTGKRMLRSVDFNQGLDANLLTKEKANLLGQIALKPARMAFDHIEDSDAYTQAILKCADVGITEFSNYILYNSDKSSGKGHKYAADKPEDLYNRLRITIDLKEEINRTSKEKISIYSFPMRYIPLNAKDRRFVGPNWNRKYLRTIQVMLTPTMGKGVSGRPFFHAAFGQDVEEFSKFLLMPEVLLLGRGRISKSNKPGDIDSKRQRVENSNEILIRRWKECYARLKKKSQWTSIIENNVFKTETFFALEEPDLMKLFLFYVSPTQFLEIVNCLKTKKEKAVILNFCKEDAPEYYEALIQHVYEKHYHYHLLEKGFYRTFGREALNHLVVEWLLAGCKDDAFLANLEKLVISARTTRFDIEALKTIYSFYLLGILDMNHQKDTLIQLILNDDYDAVWTFLHEQEYGLDQLIADKQKAGEDSEIIDVLNLFKNQLHNRVF